MPLVTLVQILGETRNSVTRAISERDRVLDLLPYVTAATVRTRQLQAEEAAIAMQVSIVNYQQMSLKRRLNFVNAFPFQLSIQPFGWYEWIVT